MRDFREWSDGMLPQSSKLQGRYWLKVSSCLREKDLSGYWLFEGKLIMHPLNPPNNIEDFRTYIRAFIDREIAPRADQWTRDRSVPKALHAAAAQAGLFGLKYSAAWGGLNRPYAFTHVMLEEFGRSGWMGCLLSLALQSEFSTPHLALYGSEALQRRFLAPAIAGTCILAIAMTEPEGGSDLVNLRTTARLVDGGYRVSGRKWMIGNASLADAFCVVMPRVGSSRGPSSLA